LVLSPRKPPLPGGGGGKKDEIRFSEKEEMKSLRYEGRNRQLPKGRSIFLSSFFAKSAFVPLNSVCWGSPSLLQKKKKKARSEKASQEEKKKRLDTPVFLASKEERGGGGGTEKRSHHLSIRA